MPAFAFWNLENLFAPENHPGREPWIATRMASDLNGWTPALFQAKLTQLSVVIAAMANNTGAVHQNIHAAEFIPKPVRQATDLFIRSQIRLVTVYR